MNRHTHPHVFSLPQHAQNPQVFVDVETIEMRDVDDKGGESNLNADPSLDSVHHQEGYKRSFVDIA